LEEDSGARYAEYDEGIEIPFANKAMKLGYGIKEKLRDVRFKKRIAPSRHSGLSSLSPKEPNNSLTIMSAGSGTDKDRMSPNSRWTLSFHSEAFRLCKL
jgi:hypothetical protein